MCFALQRTDAEAGFFRELVMPMSACGRAGGTVMSVHPADHAIILTNRAMAG